MQVVTIQKKKFLRSKDIEGFLNKLYLVCFQGGVLSTNKIFKGIYRFARMSHLILGMTVVGLVFPERQSKFIWTFTYPSPFLEEEFNMMYSES